MVEFDLGGLVFSGFILLLIGFGVYCIIKNAVKAAIRELEEEKRNRDDG